MSWDPEYCRHRTGATHNAGCEPLRSLNARPKEVVYLRRRVRSDASSRVHYALRHVLWELLFAAKPPPPNFWVVLLAGFIKSS